MRTTANILLSCLALMPAARAFAGPVLVKDGKPRSEIIIAGTGIVQIGCSFLRRELEGSVENAVDLLPSLRCHIGSFRSWVV